MAKPFKIKRITPLDPAHRAATRILRTRIREFFSHWPDPDDPPDDRQLHDQRISGKRLRYSAEMLGELYPDRLALFKDLLKRQQDLLGEAQDYVTQRTRIAADLARRRRFARRDEIAVFEALLDVYDQKRAALQEEIDDIWRGMTTKRFRKLLRATVSRPSKPTGRKTRPSESKLVAIDKAGNKPGAEAVVDVDDRDV
jgi:CHAD domain-containing protein